MAKKEKTHIPLESGVRIFCAFTDLIDLDKLKPNSRNPNQHPDDQIALLAKIIKEQGWRSPIIVSRRSGLIVKGHGRYQAAKMLKLQRVPVDYQSYDSDAAEWADLIADNRIAEFSSFSTESLASLIADISSASFDLSLTAMSQEELNQLLGKVSFNTETTLVPERWAVLIDCDDENDQKQLLENLTKKGLKCRALIS